MPNITEAKSDSISFLFKGEPSSGKSLAAASFPNCYIFDFESRITSVKNFWVPKGKKDIEYDTYSAKDFGRFDTKLDKLLANCPYETVILDTLTSLVDLMLFHGAELRGTGKGSKTALGGKVKMNTVEDYGAEDAMLRELIMFMREIKCKYKILVAHVVRTEEKKLNAESVITRQLLTAGKKPAAKLPAYFGEIYHFMQRPDMNMKPEFVAMTANTGDDFARTTLGLPREINFTNKSFYELIEPRIKAVDYVEPTEIPNMVGAVEQTVANE